MVINSDMAVNFGGNGIMANAGNGEYDLHFITSQDGFNAYDPKCAKYITDVLKQIPLKIDSVEVILSAVCGAIAEGLEERKAEKADEKAAAEQKDQPKKKAARKEEAAEAAE